MVRNLRNRNALPPSPARSETNITGAPIVTRIASATTAATGIHTGAAIRTISVSINRFTQDILPKPSGLGEGSKFRFPNDLIAILWYCRKVGDGENLNVWKTNKEATYAHNGEATSPSLPHSRFEFSSPTLRQFQSFFQKHSHRHDENAVFLILHFATIQHHRPRLGEILAERLEPLEVRPVDAGGVLDLDRQEGRGRIDDEIDLQPADRPPEVKAVTASRVVQPGPQMLLDET